MLALAVVMSATMAGAGAQSEDGLPPVPEAEKVLIFSAPTLTWRAVLDGRPPVLSGLLERSAVASLSVRTVGPRTSLGEGYVTVGAGNRATVAGDEGATTASSENVTGVMVTGLDRLEEVNEAEGFGALPGALGDALSRAGLSAGVVANADVGVGFGEEQLHREAALAVMDSLGRVPVGTVSPVLSMVDPSAPGGRIQDVAAAGAAFSAAWDSAEVVLVEASDLARLDVAASASSDETAAPAARRAALTRADELLGAVLEEVDLERHLVVVVAPTSGRAGGDGLTVAAFAGPGVSPGVATSASTNRPGYVTLPDVAPTVLRGLGIERPDSMNGTPITSTGGWESGRSRVDELVVANERATFRDEATGPFSVAFILFQLGTYLLAAAALSRWPRLRPVVSFLALVTLAQPSLTFLSGLFRYDRLGVVGYVVALFAAGAVLAILALAIARWSAGPSGRARPLVAPLLLVGLTLVVLVVDILAGGPLQLNTVFGYSPIVAGRFAGYGNLAFALVSMAALVVVTGGWAAASLRRQDDSGGAAPPRRRLILAAAVLGMVVVADGHPALGADVGGVLTLVPAGLVVLLLLRGRRVRWGHVVAIAGAAVAAMAGFAALDLARPPEERTHVGRFAAQVLEGGPGVGTVLERKLDANLSLLFSSVWALIIPFALVFLAFLVRRGPSVVRQLEGALPGMRALLVGALVLAVLGGGLNDSGVAVPAMMMAVLLPYVTVLALSLASRT